MCLHFPDVSAFFFFCCLSVAEHLYSGMQALPSHSHSVGGGWSCYDALIPPSTEKKILKSSHSQRAWSVSRRGHRAAEFPLKLSLSLSLCHLSASPPPLSLSHLSLSLDSFFCLPLFILPPSPCHFSILCLALISRLDFLIHEGFRFALLSAVSACRGDSLCSNGSILSVWQTSGITCHFIKWLLVRSSNTEAVWIELEIYSMSLLLLLLFFGELIWRITFLFLRKLRSVERFRPARGLDDWKILNSEATKYSNCVGADAGVEITAFNKWEKKKNPYFF